jgi:membrane-associated protein
MQMSARTSDRWSGPLPLIASYPRSGSVQVLVGTFTRMLQGVLDAIQSVPPALSYAIIALLVFGEAAFFAGFVVPGETAVLLGGFLASRGHLDLVTLIVIVVISAIIGDTVGYEVGKYLGPRVLRLGLFHRHQSRIETARGTLRRRGGPAVFLGRWTAFFRAMMPGMAGLSRMHYRTFLFWNALGGITWGVTFSLVGYFAGASYEKVASTIGKGSAVVIAVLVIAALVVWRVRRHRREQSEEQEYARASHHAGDDVGPE